MISDVGAPWPRFNRFTRGERSGLVSLGPLQATDHRPSPHFLQTICRDLREEVLHLRRICPGARIENLPTIPAQDFVHFVFALLVRRLMTEMVAGGLLTDDAFQAFVAGDAKF